MTVGMEEVEEGGPRCADVLVQRGDCGVADVDGGHVVRGQQQHSAVAVLVHVAHLPAAELGDSRRAKHPGADGRGSGCGRRRTICRRGRSGAARAGSGKVARRLHQAELTHHRSGSRCVQLCSWGVECVGVVRWWWWRVSPCAGDGMEQAAMWTWLAPAFRDDSTPSELSSSPLCSAIIRPQPVVRVASGTTLPAFDIGGCSTPQPGWLMAGIRGYLPLLNS